MEIFEIFIFLNELSKSPLCKRSNSMKLFSISFRDTVFLINNPPDFGLFIAKVFNPIKSNDL